MRIVLDTNIVISSILFEGTAASIASAWKEHKFIFLASRETAMEYLRVLTYPKFKLTDQEVRSIWEREILPFLTPVEVTSKEALVKEDPSDDAFLACAKYGKADYLVSGDRHLLDLKSYEKTTIISLTEFLKKLR